MTEFYWLVGASYFNTMLLDTPVDTDDEEVICCLKILVASLVAVVREGVTSIGRKRKGISLVDGI
jgi:hypothetical protein